MNTKIYKQVHRLAIQLLNAADEENDKVFDELYAELKNLCETNEADETTNHPVQWETLADFTQENELALSYYDKALNYAKAIDAKDYIASISYAMAKILLESNEKEQALELAKQAHNAAASGNDAELKKEIKGLLNRF